MKPGLYHLSEERGGIYVEGELFMFERAVADLLDGSVFLEDEKEVAKTSRKHQISFADQKPRSQQQRQQFRCDNNYWHVARAPPPPPPRPPTPPHQRWA
ncbi:unnamed protein product [Heligmosomoides polygyrus]|uniref:GDP-mannose 4,6-dehydratase n=1 Tax=Heligmosomoides polygyrus TaxID=6339 RepID=A0A183FEE3_HELPZ|nr:unnamed protein product [Heligmosomoides polygyrus]